MDRGTEGAVLDNPQGSGIGDNMDCDADLETPGARIQLRGEDDTLK